MRAQWAKKQLFAWPSRGGRHALVSLSRPKQTTTTTSLVKWSPLGASLAAQWAPICAPSFLAQAAAC